MRLLSHERCALTILLYQSIEKTLIYEFSKISSEDTYSFRGDIFKNFKCILCTQ